LLPEEVVEGEKPEEVISEPQSEEDSMNELAQSIWGGKDNMTTDDLERWETLKDLSMEQRTTLANAIVDARERYGVDIKNIWMTEFMDANALADTPVAFNSIRLHAGLDLDKLIAEANGNGLLATGDFRGIIYHELGHNIKLDFNNMIDVYNYHARFAGAVSRYAMTTNQEWFAEIFALANSTTQDVSRINYAKQVLKELIGK
jgi:hypothetical protein